MLRTLGLPMLLATALVTSACAPPATMPAPGAPDDHNTEIVGGVAVAIGLAALIAIGIQVGELFLYMHARGRAG